MTQHKSLAQRLIEDLDVDGVLNLWNEVFPHIQKPISRASALVILHMARTQMRSVRMRLRAYSHCWLIDRGMPSQLPDQLRPRAERLYPRVVEGVGFAFGTTSPIVKPAAPIVTGRVTDTILECYADNTTDPAYVQPRMMDTYRKTMHELFGKIESLVRDMERQRRHDEGMTFDFGGDR